MLLDFYGAKKALMTIQMSEFLLQLGLAVLYIVYRKLLFVPLKLLLAPIKELKPFLFQKFPLHKIVILLNKMHNRIMIPLCTNF